MNHLECINYLINVPEDKPSPRANPIFTSAATGCVYHLSYYL